MVNPRRRPYRSAPPRVQRPRRDVGSLLAMTLPGLLGAVALAFALAGLNGAVAPTGAVGAGAPTARPGQSFGDWTYECQPAGEGDGSCALGQTLLSGDTKKPLVRFNLGRDPKNAVVYLAVLLPLGLDLPAGVAGSVDNGNPFAYQIETCVPLGCIARIPAEARLLRAMKSGKALKVSFLMRGASLPTVLPASLAGIGPGITAAALE